MSDGAGSTTRALDGTDSTRSGSTTCSGPVVATSAGRGSGVDDGAVLGAEGFLAVAFLAGAAFFAGAVVFFAAVFLAGLFLAGAFLAAGFFDAAFFAAVFLAAVFCFVDAAFFFVVFLVPPCPLDILDDAFTTGAGDFPEEVSSLLELTDSMSKF